jgi:hypothetical protein
MDIVSKAMISQTIVTYDINFLLLQTLQCRIRWSYMTMREGRLDGSVHPVIESPSSDLPFCDHFTRLNIYTLNYFLFIQTAKIPFMDLRKVIVGPNSPASLVFRTKSVQITTVQTKSDWQGEAKGWWKVKRNHPREAVYKVMNHVFFRKEKNI